MGARLFACGLALLAIGGACAAPGNVTDDAVVSERWWGGDDATDDVVDDGAREHFCRGSKIARYREETNLSSSCAVVEAYCGGRGEGLFQYMHLRYCALGAAPGAATVALLALWLLLLISLLATTADCYFVPQLEALSGYLRLSPEVAGITLLALGNGAPDVFAARAALAGGASDFPLMLSDLLGASVFISTVVLGSVLLAADRARAAWRVDRRVFLRDICVYVGAVLSIFFVACDGTVELWEALLFLVIYAAYIAVVVVQSRTAAPVAPDALPRHPAAAPAAAPLDAPLLPVDAAAPPKVAGAPMAGLDWGLVRDGPAWAKVQFVAEYPFSVLRWLSIPGSDGAWDRRRRVFTAMAPPFLGLVVTLDSPWAGGNGFDYASSGGAAAPALVAAAVGAAASAAVWLTTDDLAPPRYYVLVVLAAFACTITWLDLVASELVAVIEALGRILGVSTSILGLTVIAMGNSVGDLVADTATATHLSPQMAVASCFGSPLLNDILGVGVATTAYAAKHGALASPLNAQDRVAYAFLLASLLSSLAAFPALGFFAEEKSAARGRYPYALFGLYGAFALVSCLVELDVIPQDRICALGNGGSCLRTSS